MIRLLLILPVLLLGTLFALVSDVTGRIADWLGRFLPDDL